MFSNELIIAPCAALKLEICATFMLNIVLLWICPTELERRFFEDANNNFEIYVVFNKLKLK